MKFYDKIKEKKCVTKVMHFEFNLYTFLMKCMYCDIETELNSIINPPMKCKRELFVHIDN
jgi:hypothetical protein